MSIQKILIANRGEIAVRIIRTARDLGIKTVAVFAENDKRSLHVTLADESFSLGDGPLDQTYLNIEKIITAVEKTNADAVHPGYGFLSENPHFAIAIERAQIHFIGPPASAIETMGHKVKARSMMMENNIPVVPGSDTLNTVEELKDFIDQVGFPVLLKASAGGGGRGMRQIHNLDEVESSFESCRREAKSFFNDDRVFCEKLVKNPRHIEFQILLDKHGQGVHLFERDCSIQRRHQKLFEEAPSMYLNEEQRNKMGQMAVQAGLAVGYVGAGTVEFICESPDQAWFMEMNTRIQVEHPVTEMITGIDLIAEQIHVANNKPLQWKQKDLSFHGWAMEARVNAEDPSQDFRPCPGLMERVSLPHGPFIRVDSHLYSGYSIPENYDSMVAKILAWGRTREEANARLQRALKECEFSKPTTCSFHLKLLQHHDFQKGQFSTNFISENTAELQGAHPETIPSHIESVLSACAATPQKSSKPLQGSTKSWQDTAHQHGVLQ
ncbi:MAG: acetyl/propionyl/methylcrotonyl-CoA carboxylase subunit alpha [Oligoflexales bacterium]